MTDIYSIMERSALFANLNAESTKQIIDRLQPVSFRSGQTICKEGEDGDRIFIIVEGHVAVLKETGWGQRELQRMESGEIFGEMALISKERRSASVVALTDTECLQLGEEDFTRLIDDDSHFAQRVARIVTNRLADLGKRSSDDLVHSYRALMFSLAGLAETRDPDTGAHLERTRNYCALLADLLKEHDQYGETITPAFIDCIYYVSPLHDIGKVAIPDAILLKPGRLTPEEFETMKSHTTFGAKALRDVLVESEQEIFHMGHRICLYHHEKWDGTGYPSGLAGTDIPVEARLMIFADIFDALLSRRVYKPALPIEEVWEEIENSSGTFIDPAVADTAINHRESFEAIAERYSDD